MKERGTGSEELGKDDSANATDPRRIVRATRILLILTILSAAVSIIAYWAADQAGLSEMAKGGFYNDGVGSGKQDAGFAFLACVFYLVLWVMAVKKPSLGLPIAAYLIGLSAVFGGYRVLLSQVSAKTLLEGAAVMVECALIIPMILGASAAHRLSN